MHWLTGFDGWSFYTPQAVLFHRDDRFPVWFGRAQDALSAVLTTDLPGDNIVAFSEPLVHHPDRHPFDELCELIRQRGWSSARIGVELDAHYYTARTHRHLVDGLEGARIADNRELVNWARLVKSSAELTYMREAGRIATRVMERALERLRPGVRQMDIIADVYHAQISGLDGKHGDYTSLCPLIQVGEGTATPHLTWTSDALPDEGLVVMELAAARRHYHAPLTRTAHIGTPPRDVVQACGSDRGGWRCGAGGRPSRCNMRRCGSGLAGGAEPPRLPQGESRGLFHRPRLSTRLGRTNRKPASRRQLPSSRPVCVSTSSRVCGWSATAPRSPSPSSSPLAGASAFAMSNAPSTSSPDRPAIHGRPA